MSGPTVRIYTNSKGSGDYTVVTMEGDRIFEGHHITALDLKMILEYTFGYEYLYFEELTDEEMEEGDF